MKQTFASAAWDRKGKVSTHLRRGSLVVHAAEQTRRESRYLTKVSGEGRNVHVTDSVCDVGYRCIGESQQDLCSFNSDLSGPCAK